MRPAHPVVVLPDHARHPHVVRLCGHGAALVDDGLAEPVLGPLGRRVKDDGADVQLEGRAGPRLGQNGVAADVKQAVGRRAAAEAVALPLDGQVPGKELLRRAGLQRGAGQGGLLHRQGHGRAAGAADADAALLVRLHGQGGPLFQHDPPRVRLDAVKGQPDPAVAVAPLQAAFGQQAGGLVLEVPHTLPQLEGDGRGAFQPQDVVLGQGEAVGLHLLPAGGEEGLRPLQADLLQLIGRGVDVVQVEQFGRARLDGALGLKDHVLAVGPGGEHPRARPHRHRAVHHLAGVKGHLAPGGHRPRLLIADLVEEFCVQFGGQGVHPVHRLVEHGAEQLCQGRAGVVLGLLVPPFGGIAAGQCGHLRADGVQVPRVKHRMLHTPPPPSEPSVR